MAEHTEWCRSQWTYNVGPCDCGHDSPGGVRVPRVQPKPRPYSPDYAEIEKELVLTGAGVA